jgi:hypothetical protein
MTAVRLVPIATLVLALGCGQQPHSKADAERGRAALTAALDAWKGNEPPDALKSRPDPVEFTDELRRTHKLVEYTLGEPDRTDPEVLRYPVTLKLQGRKGPPEERRVVFMVALKSPVVIARDPYE